MMPILERLYRRPNDLRPKQHIILGDDVKMMSVLMSEWGQNGQNDVSVKMNILWSDCRVLFDKFVWA